MVRTELPDCVLVSVSHRHTVEQHHEQSWNCSAKANGGSAGSRETSPRRSDLT